MTFDGFAREDGDVVNDSGSQYPRREVPLQLCQPGTHGIRVSMDSIPAIEYHERGGRLAH